MAWVLVFFAATAGAVEQSALQRVYTDAAVIDRIAEVSGRALPAELMKRIIDEDIELLRGKRDDGSYEHATYERLEAGRESTSYSVQPRKDDALERIEIRGSWVYRLLVSSPSRRLLFTRNRSVFIDRVELEYIPEGSTTSRTESIAVQEWLERGDTRPIDFPEVARQATVRLFARADPDAGYGNVVLALVRARIVDNADSPYADAVASARAISRAIDAGEVPSIRAMAGRIRDGLAPLTGGEPAGRSVEVVAAPDDEALFAELQAIQDLLNGTESERLQGMDRLNQLVLRLRR
ncbi:MAG TPA: hypothetical protein VNA04_07455 [Thermoanaerobaculia bacterium]|nr:hypothetical protein [Thermoanaerobaculia bacterium]